VLFRSVFMSQLYRIIAPMGVDYLSVQAWVGIFTGLYMIIIAVTDSCSYIQLCSRFTQDLFGFFVSIIFISMGIGNIVDKFTVKSETYHAPVQLIITVAMLYTAVTLAGFSKARFFNSKIRELVADFAVAISVVIFTAIANLITVPLEPLPVPPQFAPTDTTRSWFVNLGCPACAGIGLVAAIPLVVLFFVDQNVTSLLTQHADHNLKKGAAYHYNFLILGVFNMCFPLFGCPFVTGSLPHSPQFVHALARKEVIREGGVDRTLIVEVYENRIAPLLVSVLILVSLPVIGKLRYIPTAVICDALFLFMGLSGLPGNQLFERLKLIFTEEALYPPLRFTKEDVPRKQMHLFTAFQLMVVGVLFAVTRSPVAVAFPVFLVSSIFLHMKLPWITCGFITKEAGPDMVVVHFEDWAKEGKKEDWAKGLPVPPLLGGSVSSWSSTSAGSRSSLKRGLEDCSVDEQSQNKFEDEFCPDIPERQCTCTEGVEEGMVDEWDRHDWTTSAAKSDEKSPSKFWDCLFVCGALPGASTSSCTGGVGR